MTSNNYWKLYRLISKTKDIGEKRHPMFEQNKYMKWFGYVMVAFWACYLILFGVILGRTMKDGGIEGFDYIDGGMIFFLATDFLLRLMLTDTPAQEVKQFKLMPISVRFLLNTFLIRRATSLFNVIWLFFFVPFGLFQIPHFFGMTGLLVWIVSIWLLFVANAYWYLLWRTLLNRNMLFILIPVLLYAITAYIGVFDDKYTQMILGKQHVQPLFYACLWFGRQAMQINPVPILVTLVAIAVLYYLNIIVQSRSIYREIAEVHEGKVKSREMAFFNRFGIVGEYIKLEIKSTMRNAVVRKQFMIGVCGMVSLSVLFAFTSVYDNMPFMQAYITMYCYSVLSTMTLTTVMCAEGNYIDGLMARKESVLSLLKAKYIFNLALLALPFIVFLVPVFQGKSSFFDAFGSMMFSAGVVMPCLFQMAVYNDNTIHLNSKVTRQGKNSKAQMVISFAALFLPMFIMYILLVLTPHYSGLIMSIIGFIGVILHPLWLRNIYNRFMARRYKNMNGFRNSRES